MEDLVILSEIYKVGSSTLQDLFIIQQHQQQQQQSQASLLNSKHLKSAQSHLLEQPQLQTKPPQTKMQYLTIAAALSALLAPALAAPVAEATEDYHWQVSKFQFGRGQDAYDYSFTVTGDQEGKTPGFTATCTGTNVGGFKACSILPEGGHAAIPTILANVNIVTDPSNSDDTIPRVFVRETYTNKAGCTFTQTGHYDKSGFNQPVGGNKGSKFQIIPAHAKAVC